MKTDLIKTSGLIVMALLMMATVNAQSPRQGNRGPASYSQEKWGPGSYSHGNRDQGEFGQGHGRMFAHLSLDLTTEQEEAMKNLRTENYKTMKPLKNQMVELKARERTLMSEETVDLKAVNKVIDDQTDLINKMRKIQASHKVEVKEILTDEQEMKLEQRSQFKRNKGQGAKRGYHRNMG